MAIFNISDVRRTRLQTIMSNYVRVRKVKDKDIQDQKGERQRYRNRFISVFLSLDHHNPDKQ